jgi:Uncharacterized conserved protein
MKALSGRHNSNCIIYADSVDPSAIVTLQSILDNEVSSRSKIRVMPDIHGGVDSVIGLTMTVDDKFIPNYLGNDIGCGVLGAFYTKDSLQSLMRDKKITHNKLKEIASTEISPAQMRSVRSNERLYNLVSKISEDPERIYSQIGILGRGNHFIEIGSYLEDYVISIHCGPKSLGNKTFEYYIKSMKAHKEKYLSGRRLEEYLVDCKIVSEFAATNRRLILEKIKDTLSLPEELFKIDTIHNYIDDDRMMRKGATSATLDEMLLIPLNMRDGILLCSGLGNPNWNCSAPHGSGRKMSRSGVAAKYSVEEFEQTMEGIVASVSVDTISESPFAYKDSSKILSTIEDTVEVIDIIKPIINIKL